MIVKDSVVHALPSRTITILRGEPSTLPDPSAEAGLNAEPVQQRAAGPSQPGSPLPGSIIAIRATVYNKQRSLLQWRDPGSGAEYEAWSNIDFNHLSALSHFESNAHRWILLLAIVNIDTTTASPATGATVPEPAHPEIPAGAPAFVLTKGDPSNQGPVAPLDTLHDLYEVKAAEWIASAAAQKQIREQQAAEQANSAQPQNNVMWFRPRKGSRYLQEEGGNR